MIDKYKYRPPFKYFFIGLSGFMMAFIFGLGLLKSEIWISIIMGVFCLMSLILGVGFLTIFFRKFGTGDLIIGNNCVEIPGRWRSRERIKFEEILDIGELDTYDNVIEIESEQGIHLIERNWMKQKDFDNVKKKLKEYWLNS